MCVLKIFTNGGICSVSNYIVKCIHCKYTYKIIAVYIYLYLNNNKDPKTSNFQESWLVIEHLTFDSR